MDFIQYLQLRHHKQGGSEMGEKSAKQYNNRLENMVKYGIYKGETSLTPEINEKISQKYVNARGEYQRTIKYYLEFLKTDQGKC
ncbi:hypothetical protein [Metabacillus fastidiosus]|uniref:hypothetical protein n=1 Tax=Metabacillus fastidiosus TaxID=1458 RepID=UPI002DBB9ED3|nr:hypothetical protein [Metabacillus fastidiosus]MEC2078432.1 hypothetical protein [Metabacillus fastidiosus]